LPRGPWTTRPPGASSRSSWPPRERPMIAVAAIGGGVLYTFASLLAVRPALRPLGPAGGAAAAR
jgi:hypothetical protein